MIKFSKSQSDKYSCSRVTGTGYLAFRDLEFFASKNHADLSYVLDLGCGSGRSTEWLQNFCQKVNGCDIDDVALANANKKFDESVCFFKSNRNMPAYDLSKYKTIFSILMFFHFSSRDEIIKELKLCYESLDSEGSLIIVSGTKNLYSANYLTVEGVGDPPETDGDRASVRLKSIDCVVEDFYWSEAFILSVAAEVGFNCLDAHHPTGRYEDDIAYRDELFSPPYYYLMLKK